MDSKEFKSRVEDLMRSITVQMDSCMRRFCENFGLTPPQAMVLIYLHNNGQGRITDVASKLHMTNSNVSMICRRLERDGLIQRRRDTEDQRIVWISLSENCQGRLEQLGAEIDQHYLSGLYSLSEAERTAMLDCLMKLDHLLTASQEEIELEEISHDKENKSES